MQELVEAIRRNAGFGDMPRSEYDEQVVDSYYPICGDDDYATFASRVFISGD